MRDRPIKTACAAATLIIALTIAACSGERQSEQLPDDPTAVASLSTPATKCGQIDWFYDAAKNQALIQVGSDPADYVAVVTDESTSAEETTKFSSKDADDSGRYALPVPDGMFDLKVTRVGCQ